MRNFIKKIFTRKKEKYSISSLRESFLYFGYDLSDYSDEEIIDGVSDIGKAVSVCGISCDQSNGIFKQLSNQKLIT